MEANFHPVGDSQGLIRDNSQALWIQLHFFAENTRPERFHVAKQWLPEVLLHLGHDVGKKNPWSGHQTRDPIPKSINAVGSE